MRNLVGEISLSPAVRHTPTYEAIKANKDKFNGEEYQRMLLLLGNHLRSRIYELGFWVGDQYSNQ